jgi:hypothetical protein
MKRGPKKPAPHVAPRIPEHIAALEIVKSVRSDGSYVCVHDLELTECDDCGPVAMLADEEVNLTALDAPESIVVEDEDALFTEDRPHGLAIPEVPEGSPVPCRTCGQTAAGQHGEYPCATCGLPMVHDDSPAMPPGDDSSYVSFTCQGCGKPIGGGCWGCDGTRLTAPDESMPEDLSVACAALGLSIGHVLTHAIRADGSVSIITRGGKRLFWPCSDEARQAALQLTEQERDGRIRDHDGTVLPPGKWLTTPHKF